MIIKFEVRFLTEAEQFVNELKLIEKSKIYENIRRAQMGLDNKFFKKLDEGIWEFRTLVAGKQIRLFAFWDHRRKNETLVIATHGIIKKKDKVDRKEIDKANMIRARYFKEYPV